MAEIRSRDEHSDSWNLQQVVRLCNVVRLKTKEIDANLGAKRVRHKGDNIDSHAMIEMSRD